MNEIIAINDVTDKGMELLSCVTMINRATKMLVTAPEQKDRCINIISAQAQAIEQAFEEYKSSVLNAVRDIAGEDVDSVSGFEENNGVRL